MLGDGNFLPTSISAIYAWEDPSSSASFACDMSRFLRKIFRLMIKISWKVIVLFHYHIDIFASIFSFGIYGANKIPIGQAYSLSQARFRREAQGGDPGNIQQFPRRAVRLRGVPFDATNPVRVPGVYHVPNLLRQLPDCQVRAAADVDEIAGGIRQVAGVVVSHQHDQGSRQIGAEQEFAAGRPVAPKRHRVGTGNLRLVEFADEGGQYVGTVGIVVVARAVQIGRHRGKEIRAVLSVVIRAKLYHADLRHRVCLVRGFQQIGQKIFLFHGLRRKLGINAGRAKVEKLLHPGFIRGVNHVETDHRVLVDEIGGIGRVGADAPDPGRGEENVLGPFPLEKRVDRRLVEQVQFV